MNLSFLRIPRIPSYFAIVDDLYYYYYHLSRSVSPSLFLSHLLFVLFFEIQFTKKQNKKQRRKTKPQTAAPDATTTKDEQFRGNTSYVPRYLISRPLPLANRSPCLIKSNI